MLGKTSFLFITAHFASGDGNTQGRNADFHRINSTMELYSKFNGTSNVFLDK